MNRGCEERLSHCIICGARGFYNFSVWINTDRGKFLRLRSAGGGISSRLLPKRCGGGKAKFLHFCSCAMRPAEKRILRVLFLIAVRITKSKLEITLLPYAPGEKPRRVREVSNSFPKKRANAHFLC